MGKWMRRSGFAAAVMCAMVALAVPSLASAATARPSINATHNGTWNATAVTNESVDTPGYTTRNKASGCVDGVLTSANLSFQLIWFHGGRDTVLWGSRIYTTGVRHCSPTKTIKNPPHGPVVFLRITIHCQNEPIPCQGDGDWSIKTN
jgi:hypothetical protein